LSIDPYDHVICIKCYYRDLLVKMLKFAFLGVYGYTPYQCDLTYYIHNTIFRLPYNIHIGTCKNSSILNANNKITILLYMLKGEEGEDRDRQALMASGAGPSLPFISGGVGPSLLFMPGGTRPLLPFACGGLGPLFTMRGHHHLWVVLLGGHHFSWMEVLGSCCMVHGWWLVFES